MWEISSKECRIFTVTFVLALAILLAVDKLFVLHNMSDITYNAGSSAALHVQLRQSGTVKQKRSIGAKVTISNPTIRNKTPTYDITIEAGGLSSPSSSRSSSRYDKNADIVQRLETASKDPKDASSTSSSTVSIPAANSKKRKQMSQALLTAGAATADSTAFITTYVGNFTGDGIVHHVPHKGNIIDTCSAEVSLGYRQADGSGEDNLKWCKSAMNQYNVKLGRSWGSLSRNMQKDWDSRKCNELVVTGKLLSCDERWGWGFLDEWLQNSKNIIHGQSNVTCIVNLKTSTFCRSNNVVIDFSKVHVTGLSRSFATGFYTSYGTRTERGVLLDIPGRKHEETDGDEYIDPKCDVHEKRPVFVVSNDDNFNLGHYFNDVMSVWSMAVLAGRDTKDAVLLNFDGLRKGGPAGGPAHRLMIPSDPDNHGPYIGYFNSWFAELTKAKGYGNKRVCFSELYLPPTPGVPWFWNDWGIVSECSVKAASPLYQSFNMFLRQRWAAKYGQESLPNPDTDKVHIVIEVRAINKAKQNNHSSARHIKNLAQLVAALKAIPGVRVTAQDFAKIPFSEQVKLSHSAGVFVSMHGAGTTHIFHAAIGTPNCCALVELQPDHSIGFQTAHGYGNLARMHGMHYYRYEASDGRTTGAGTEVEVDVVKGLIEKAVSDVRTKPTCQHSVRDTRTPVYSPGAL